MMRKFQFYAAVLLLITFVGINHANAVCYVFDAKTTSCQIYPGNTATGSSIGTTRPASEALCASTCSNCTPCVQPPIATNVAITGTPNVGQSLSGSYTFAPAGEEGTSTFKWYSGSDAACTGKASVGTAITYMTAAADKDKYFCFEVTPVNTSGIAGTPVMSAGVKVTGCTDVIIDWANPADITSGTALSDAQLNAAVTVGGTLTYTPTAGTVLAEGNAQNLTVHFVPNDPVTSCPPADKTVQINVIPPATQANAPIYGSSPAPGTLTMNSCTPTNASTSLTVTNNTGSAVLNITAIALGGTNAAKFTVSPSAAPIAVAVGKSQVFTISSIGSTAGTFTGTLEIAHNAVGSPAKYTLSSVTKDCVTTSDTFMPPNHAPVADRIYASTEVDKPISIKLTGSDADIVSWLDMLLKPLASSVLTQPAHGILSGTAPNLTYKPNQGFVGTDSFNFKMSDGIADSAKSTVSVIVHQNSHVYVGDKYEMDIFCAEYQGVKYGFRLNYTPIAADPSGLYWKMDLDTFGKAYSDTKGCIPVGNDFQIVIPSASYNGVTYQFTLNYNPISGDAFGLYWKMDLGTFKSR